MSEREYEHLAKQYAAGQISRRRFIGQMVAAGVGVAAAVAFAGNAADAMGFFGKHRPGHQYGHTYGHNYGCPPGHTYGHKPPQHKPPEHRPSKWPVQHPEEWPLKHTPPRPPRFPGLARARFNRFWR